MLQREDAAGLIVISQLAHAWVSGQLARAWGNQRFGEFAPREEICQAAEQHDLGFLKWEQAPTLNPQNGLPHTFMDLPTRLHLEIWSAGIQDMLLFGRYPALLVSLHFTAMCERHPLVDQPEEARLKRDFLADQTAFQSALLTSLRNDSHYAPFSGDDLIARHRQLMAAWDWLSLLLCIGLDSERVVEEVPSREGLATLTLTPAEARSGRVIVAPWPFHSEPVKLVCEGKRLPRHFKAEGEMREALRTAPTATLQIELLPP
jgi:hypothetical protein